jgi:RNA polymerase sigma factor (sigma-70 family)
MALTLRQECEAGYDKLLEIAMRITGNKEEASRDLVGDGICKALEYEDRYKEGSTFFGWMFFIMRGVYLKRVSRRTEANTVYTDKPLDLMGDWRERSVEPQNGRYLDMEKALASLDESEYECILLQMYGYSCTEISRVFNVPVGTVKRRLFDIRNKIRGFYNESQGHQASALNGSPGPLLCP